MKVEVKKYRLTFIRPSGTSRGILTHKLCWIIQHLDEKNNLSRGECSIIEGLSPDFNNETEYEQHIQLFLSELNELKIKSIEELYQSVLLEKLTDFPSILAGIEMFLLNLAQTDKNKYYKNEFSEGNKKIPINGLIWMGDEQFMQQQIEEKLSSGFTCIKMKVGAIDLTLRVDANGAFNKEDALHKLDQLAKLDIHSIEQPIKAGQWDEMQKLCKQTPLAIALDEELIGQTQKDELLDYIQPQYIILKPSLHGGFFGANEWIEKATHRNIPWWITSALESNIGLNAIAQFTGNFPIETYHGLGTGALYQQNFNTKLKIENGELFMSSNFSNLEVYALD
jgi:L-alanine-DL-glutamate epimerase-like enolase superfamily enzyme